MKYSDNIIELNRLPLDYMGMIFFPKSPRYMELQQMPDINIKRVGVFVDAEMEYIEEKMNQYDLDMIQLHGNESPETCKELMKTIDVIKAFNICEITDFDQTKNYENHCNYFLFDTKTGQHGGSGKKFDWQLLDSYTGNTCFFLSGGISVNDVKSIKSIKHPLFYGIDLNSRFETKPGLKNIQLLQQFIKALKDEQD